MHAELLKALKQKTAGRPHALVGFMSSKIDRVLTLNENTVIYPLMTVGSMSQIEIVKTLLSPLGVQFDSNFAVEADRQYVRSESLSLALVLFETDEQANKFHHHRNPSVTTMLRLMRSYTGAPVRLLFSVYRVSNGDTRVSFQMGPGNIVRAPDDFISEEFLKEAFAAHDRDHRISRYLRFANSAFSIDDAEFRIALTFQFLESLSAPLSQFMKVSGRDHTRTRDRVRLLLGYYEDYQFPVFDVGDKRATFNLVELAGLVRDRYFHGSELSREDVPHFLREGCDLLSNYPDLVSGAFRREAERGLSETIKRIGVIARVDSDESVRPPWDLRNDDRKSASLLLCAEGDKELRGYVYFRVQGGDTREEAPRLQVSGQ